MATTAENREEKTFNSSMGEMYPEIIGRAIDALQVIAPDLTRETLLGLILSNLSYALCCMRVQFRETANSKTNFPNLFTAFYLHSNMGKDSTASLVKQTLFAGLKAFQVDQEKRFDTYRYIEVKNQVLEKYPDLNPEKHPNDDKIVDKLEKKIEDERKKDRHFTVGANSAGTSEGLYAEISGYRKRMTGAIFVQQSEAGAFADSKSERKQEFLTSLYTMYDNRIEGRNLRDESFPTIEGVPVVAEFLSSPDIVKQNKNFRARQTTALGRRIWVFMQDSWQKSIEIPKEAEYVKAKDTLIKIGEELFEILKPMQEKNQVRSDRTPDNYEHVLIPFNKGVYDDCYIPYKIKNIERYNLIEDELVRLSVSEYPFRACKVACLYSVLNHPDLKVITKEDFEMAVKTVENNDGMATLTGYSPIEKDYYDLLADGLVYLSQKSDNKPQRYGKAPLQEVFQTILRGKVSKGLRGFVRGLLSPEKYAVTKNTLKIELQSRGYDLIEPTDGTDTNFAGFEVVKISAPTVVEPADLDDIKKDIEG